MKDSFQRLTQGTHRKNDYFVGKEKESGKWFFGGGGFKKKDPKPDPLEEYIKSLRKGSLGLPKTPWQSKMDLGKKASSANSLFVEAQSQDGDSDSSKCTYVFAFLLRKNPYVLQLR